MDERSWQNRIVGHGEEAPDQLLANPRNWRIHSQAQQDALSSVLEHVGLVQSVVVNQRSGFVVDGHLRVALALRSEQATVPVTYVDLTDEEERVVLASLDSITAMAGTDEEKLSELLASVDREDVAGLLAAVAAAEGVEMSPEGAVPAQPAPRSITCPECGCEFTPGATP